MGFFNDPWSATKNIVGDLTGKNDIMRSQRRADEEAAARQVQIDADILGLRSDFGDLREGEEGGDTDRARIGRRRREQALADVRRGERRAGRQRARMTAGQNLLALDAAAAASGLAGGSAAMGDRRSVALGLERDRALSELAAEAAAADLDSQIESELTSLEGLISGGGGSVNLERDLFNEMLALGEARRSIPRETVAGSVNTIADLINLDSAGRRSGGRGLIG